MYRIGFAKDIHRLEKNGRPFILGGVQILHELGPVSHSDGDCLYHAVTESLLGALALGDLGHHFPDDDLKFKVTFDIYITLNGGKVYKSNINLELPVNDVVNQGTQSMEYTDLKNIVFKRV